MQTGLWINEHEVPASREARTIAEVLNAPPDRAERDRLRAEQQAAASRAAEASLPDTRGFIARLTGRRAGTPLGEVLARATAADDAAHGGPSPRDLHRARQLLAEHNLDHVLPPRIDAVFDANVGALEPRRTREVPADGDAVLRAESRALDRRQAAERQATEDLIRESQRRRQPPGEWPSWGPARA